MRFGAVLNWAALGRIKITKRQTDRQTDRHINRSRVTDSRQPIEIIYLNIPRLKGGYVLNTASLII